MASNNNLADLFFTGGATTSQAVEAENDEHFENTTFKLKRTRSLGLLDDFISPPQKFIDDDYPHLQVADNRVSDSSSSLSSLAAQANANAYANAQASVRYRMADEFANPSVDMVSSAEESESEPELELMDEATQTDTQQPGYSDEPPLVTGEIVPHDDTDLVYEPSRHVDYLSHKWKESDISKSWRYITLRRRSVANSARLENASWRTWAQQKYRLKTISPESVNWLKDSDVTWLYGPIYKDPHHSEFFGDERAGSETRLSDGFGLPRTPAVQSPPQSDELALSPAVPSQPKPILKKRTVSEMMISHADLLKISIAADPSKVKNRSPTLENIKTSPPTQGNAGDVSITSRLNPYFDTEPQGQSMPDFHRALSPISLTNEMPSTFAVPIKKEFHIHFNDRVEQCMAVDVISDEEIEEKSDESDADSASDDEDGLYLKIRSPSTPNLVPFQAITPATTAASKYQTIELLPSTTLKYGSDEEDNDYTLSHNSVDSSRGYGYLYDYNSVYTGNRMNDVLMVDLPADIELGPDFDNVNIEQIEDVPNISTMVLPNQQPRSPLIVPHQPAVASPLIKPVLVKTPSATKIQTPVPIRHNTHSNTNLDTLPVQPKLKSPSPAPPARRRSSSTPKIEVIKNPVVNVPRKLQNAAAIKSSDGKRKSILKRRVARRGLISHSYASSHVPGSNSPTPESTPAPETKEEKHIHFSDRVEQSQILDPVESDEEEEDRETEEDDSDDEGGFVLKVKSHSNSNLSAIQGMANLSIREPPTPVGSKFLQSLPCTSLRYGSDEDNDYTLSHNVNSSRGHEYLYDYNTVYTSEQDDMLVVDLPAEFELGPEFDNTEELEDVPIIFQHSEPPIRHNTHSNSSLNSFGRPSGAAKSGFSFMNSQDPLPPQTTSKNASGKMKTFSLDSDSGSDSEAEYIEDVATVPVRSPSGGSPSSPITYASLSEVAAKNDIKNESESSESNSTASETIKLVNSAKGIASQFLGNWRSASNSSSNS